MRHIFRISRKHQSVLDADTAAWIAGVVNNGGAVSAGRQTLVNDLIVSLKADGIWDKLDVLWLFAAEDQPSALTDLVSLILATAVNSPTFSVDEGYTSNGTTQYINTNHGPSDGPNAATGNSSFHLWDNTSRTSAGGGAPCAMGTAQVENYPYLDGDVVRLGAGGGCNYTNTNAQGFFTGTRSGTGDGSGDNQGYKNGSALTFVSGNFDFGLTGNDLFILARNSAGSPDRFTTDQISAAAVGGHLTAGEAADFYTHLQTYMTGVGL